MLLVAATAPNLETWILLESTVKELGKIILCSPKKLNPTNLEGHGRRWHVTPDG